ncbi:hypothetical protein DSM104443_01736 [Usitatibacter rugosus]|uniref:Uncharacterized protein n=1 Tax=Usitatibacter rugosus TaxID=2732067 RepID=A0A6M4GTK1_9PROT|nr:hypothetical protein [Usitatibacter rugosus]QJR10669.1 hypothetical protein DSM104443_01736 [Usitatibacter rugosus]
MNSQMMTYFCVAYGPSSVTLDSRGASTASTFRRANPLGAGAAAGPVAGIVMIHRDIDAPVAIGISQPLEKSDAARRSELQKGDPEGRVRIGRFHATADQAIQEMKDKWAALQAAGMVYAEVCCVEVSAALGAPAR